MNILRIYAIFIRQIFLLRQSFTRFWNLFIWITLDIVLWGFITKYLDLVEKSATVNFFSFFLGAVILWGFLTRVQEGVMLAFLEDVWSRNFINLFASPLIVGEYILGLVSTSVVTSLIGFGIMLVLASLAFGYSLLALGTFLFPFLLVLFLFGLTLGIITAAIVLRLGPAAEWLAWPLPFIFQPFIGVFYPISVLPPVLRYVSYLLPPSYIFEGMRAVLLSGSFSVYDLAMAGGLSVFYLALSYFVFIAVYRSVVRKGLIARFSAEDA